MTQSKKYFKNLQTTFRLSVVKERGSDAPAPLEASGTTLVLLAWPMRAGEEVTSTTSIKFCARQAAEIN
jgi:hypothetical protein